MYFLWVFGDNVEDHLGKNNFLWLLLISVVVGFLFFGWFHKSGVPAIGASGGISGLIAFYIVRFPFRKFVLTYAFFIRIAIPGYLLGALFFMKDFLGFLVEVNSLGTNVAHSAHLGGAIVGVLFATLSSSKKNPVG